MDDPRSGNSSPTVSQLSLAEAIKDHLGEPISDLPQQLAEFLKRRLDGIGVPHAEWDDATPEQRAKTAKAADKSAADVVKRDAQEAEKREAGLYTLQELAGDLAGKTGWAVKRWLDIIVDAVLKKDLPARNPGNLTDRLPYTPTTIEGGDYPIREWYEQVSASDVDRWLTAHPEWHVSLRSASRRRSKAQIAVMPPAAVERPGDSAVYMSFDAACKELEARTGIAVSLTELLRHAAHASVVVHWDTSSLHLEGQRHRLTDAPGELSDVDDNPIEPVPPGVYEVDFLDGGASDFLLALANGKEWPQSAPTLVAPTDSSFFWELLEGDPDVPEWKRGEYDYLPSSQIPDISELRVDLTAVDTIENRIKRLPRPKRNTAASISEPQPLQGEAGISVVKTTTHVIGTRSNSLKAILEKAKSTAPDQSDLHSVWAALVKMAQDKSPPAPLLGFVEDEGVKWDDSGKVKFLTKKALGDRLRRAKAR